jgi:hypothetical protein
LGFDPATGGVLLGAAFLAHGAMRWAFAWSKSGVGGLAVSNAVSLFTFWLMIWATALAQGWASFLVLLYVGFQAVQTYLFGLSLADLDRVRSMMPKNSEGKRWA